MPQPSEKQLSTSRRDALKTIALAGAGCFVASRSRAESPEVPELVRYLQKHARANGGFGWEDQERAHLTPTFAVIGAYRALGVDVPEAERVAAFVRENHPARLKKLEQERRVFDYQQIQALAWLGEEDPASREKVLTWTRPLEYKKAYEQHGWPVFSSEMGAFLCRKILKLPVADLSPHFTGYLDSRRRANGSFNNTPAEDGSDGHVLNTWWGLQALDGFGRSEEKAAAMVEWIHACQLPSGAFTWQPNAPFAKVDDVAYTWAAVAALRFIGAKIPNRDACIAWLLSLWNSDGGFADRPGWRSNPLATYYAVETLSRLDAWGAARKAPRREIAKPPAIPDDLRVYSVQFEAHGQGSPAEAVDLARSLPIHLWGAKNAKPEWLRRVREIAAAGKAPVEFFTSNEEYGTWVNVPGLGTYSHTSDIVAPAGAEIGASLAAGGVAVSWEEFRERRLAPLHAAGGRLLWQFGENEELVRLFLDDSIERGGYAAISTFHFGNPDFTNSEPFLHRWRGQIPFVALQDAHGPEPWWFADMTAGFRTLFFAKEPTWQGWLDALENRRVVAVRRDELSGNQLWMHAPSRAALEFARAREREWRWWDNPEIARPLVSIVPVRPTDTFETACPEQGVMLRIRCAWENTPQGVAKSPLTEFVRLTVDDVEVAPEPIEIPKGRGFADAYHQHPVTAPGRHRATVVVRDLLTNRKHERSIAFEV